MTPAEFERRVWAHNKRVREDNEIRSKAAEHAMSLAWATAKLLRLKRMPSLELFLRPKARVVAGEEKKKMDADFDDLVRSFEGK